jgi:hypothetical protein
VSDSAQERVCTRTRKLPVRPSARYWLTGGLPGTLRELLAQELPKPSTQMGTVRGLFRLDAPRTSLPKR